jgi:hypothetical protein
MLAGEPPSIAHVHETRPRGNQGSSAGVNGAPPHEETLDDWLGDISDEDWSEDATRRAERRRATSAYEEPPVPADDLGRGHTAERPAPARPVAAAEAHRAAIERRRLVAGLVLVVAVALAAAIAVVLLRGGSGGSQAQTTPAREPTVTTPAPTETSPPPAPTTPSTTTPTTTPSTPGAATFTVPEGTKLQRGEEGDPALIEQLQQALSKAGYDPGPADGNFGRLTEAAVVAFQEANGLSVDGRVGPETASALNSAVADG